MQKQDKSSIECKEKDMLSTESKAVNQLTGIFRKFSILKKLTKQSDINYSLVPFCPESDTMIKEI